MSKKGFPVTESMVTNEMRIAFVSLLKPEVKKHPVSQEEYKQWGFTGLIPKGEDIAALKALAMEAVEKAWPDEKSRPRKFNPTFKDGDSGEHTKDGVPAGEKWDGFANHIYINFIAYRAPGVVHQRDIKTPIRVPDEVYGGCYGRAQVCAQAYQNKSGSGVRFYVQNFMKTRDGEAFSGGGKQKAEDAFASFASANDSWDTSSDSDNGLF